MIRQVLFVVTLILVAAPCYQAQNIYCMMLHCSNQAKNCMLDNDCRHALTCIQGCGTTNQTCMFRCLYSYEDALFDNFMKCAITEHKCINLQPPDPSFQCKRPQRVVQNLPPEQLRGSWYIVLGRNPTFDCFDCQITTYTPSSVSGTISVTEKFDVTAIDGTLKHRVVNETAKVNSTIGGILEYASMQMGHETSTEWRILDVDPNGKYMIGYYCGHVSANWFYEGSVVYSRTQTLDSTSLTTIKVKMTSFGYDISQYCSPKTTGCVG